MAKQVIHRKAECLSGLRIMDFDDTWSREALGAALHEACIRDNYRMLSCPKQRPGVTVGLSNVHQITGRVE